METEFKEKTYEKYFFGEIARLTRVTYSPDACDEESLGFDDAFLLPLDWIAGRFPFVRRRRWTRMDGVVINELERVGERLGRRMPPFRFNLFVQYKRPVFLKTRGAGEWEHWRCPYYRYLTTPHQQEVLERIETQSNGRAATIYASPAFWKADDLFAHARAEKIVETSNIASVGRLSGHRHYSYISPGFKGKGHSDVTDIESTAFNEIIAKGLKGEPLQFNVHLKQAAKVILDAVRGSDKGASTFDQGRVALGAETLDEGSLANAIAIIQAFSDAFEITYMAIG